VREACALEKVNITLEDNLLSIYESKHKEGYILHPHRHEIHQILYAIDGHGEMMLDGQWYEFAQDHAVVITPNTLHAVQSERSLTVLVIAFKMDEEMPILPVHFFHTYYPLSQLIRTDKGTSTALRHIFRKMLFLHSKPEELNRWAARVQLCEVLIHLSKAREDIHNTKFPAMASRIKRYIEQHYYEIQSAADIAARHHMSVRYMDNLFKEHLQKTPVQYLTEVRVARAQTLLSESNHEIISICFEVGYESVSTFYRCFKQITGVTPQQYRKRIATQSIE